MILKSEIINSMVDFDDDVEMNANSHMIDEDRSLRKSMVQMDYIGLEIPSYIILETPIEGTSTTLVCPPDDIDFQEFHVIQSTFKIWDPGGVHIPHPPSLEDKRNLRGVD